MLRRPVVSDGSARLAALLGAPAVLPPPDGAAPGWTPTVRCTDLPVVPQAEFPPPPAVSPAWTPDQDDDPFWPEPGWVEEEEPERSWSVVRSSSSSAPAPAPVPRPDPEVAPGVGGPSVLGVLRGGLFDPGRRGVVALVALGLVGAVVAGVLLLRSRPHEQPVQAPSVVGGAADPTGGPEVVVAVGGKVRRPGLVHLPTGSRVDDAVRAAGGALPGTDLGLLNLARKLVDGEQVLVGVAAPAALPGAAAGASAGGLLDLNAAAVGDFDALPGIGPVLAQRIVDWRTEHGRFASVDQLREVSGIGESKYQSLKVKVRV